MEKPLNEARELPTRFDVESAPNESSSPPGLERTTASISAAAAFDRVRLARLASTESEGGGGRSTLTPLERRPTLPLLRPCYRDVFQADTAKERDCILLIIRNLETKRKSKIAKHRRVTRMVRTTRLQEGDGNSDY